MSPLISPETVNATLARPAYFFLLGFTGIPYIKVYYIFLFFVFSASVLGNAFVMAVIVLDRSLHSSKYIIVFNLAFTDFCGSTTLVPQILNTFLFGSQFVSYNECLTSLFFNFVFLSMQSLNLSTLAYDRLMAICYPLRYYMIVNHRAMLLIVGGQWMLSGMLMLTVLWYITRLSFCNSLVIPSFFCDHGPLFRLACNDTSINFVLGMISIVFILWLPLLFIIVTYSCITTALLKISVQERIKAMKTCTSHLILVGLFYLPIGVTFVMGNTIPTNARIFNLSLTSVLPPLLNPIIYVLKTEEFKVSAKKVLQTAKGAIFSSE